MNQELLSAFKAAIELSLKRTVTPEEVNKKIIEIGSKDWYYFVSGYNSAPTGEEDLKKQVEKGFKDLIAWQEEEINKLSSEVLAWKERYKSIVEQHELDMIGMSKLVTSKDKEILLKKNNAPREVKNKRFFGLF